MKLNYQPDFKIIRKYKNCNILKSKNRRIKIFHENEDNIILIEIIKLLTEKDIENFKNDTKFKSNYNFQIINNKIMITRLKLSKEVFNFLFDSMLFTKIFNEI